ncbi:MAG: 30S ribosomal protein S18 [bacterium]|jgi:small subunit ribosomal protein S18|nr:30S ribosomal protein S18 [Planctomycetota bacterium]HIL52237.1 30S ribosomal protein S18 [Planctomycetota bacterium]
MAFGRRGRRAGRGLVKLGRKTDEKEPFDYKNIDLLKKFLTPQGQIMGRRRSGYCAQSQRRLKVAIKRARHLGLLPFVG